MIAKVIVAILLAILTIIQSSNGFGIGIGTGFYRGGAVGFGFGGGYGYGGYGGYGYPFGGFPRRFIGFGRPGFHLYRPLLLPPPPPPPPPPFYPYY
ncbi:unnamed protein product [Diabrotica balteata]|uniref:Uncharacterized protein n=1 Tax=Diabrotica balteata TaxID=107213 RepID=A0A9N9SYL0_DIABA|nr:unnamed protein product [Diabrotica balteata]